MRSYSKHLLTLLVYSGLLVAAFWLTGSAHGDDGFSEDAEASVEQAVKDKKDLMLLFTGSDWCPPCKRLEAEVFSKKEFQEGAKEDFVLVKFDFPRQSEQPDNIRQQNEEFSNRFGVGSFPTVIFCDNKLRPVSFAGYEEGGPDNYLGLLKEAQLMRIKRDEKLRAADKVKGDERAKLLDEAISEIGEEIVGVYYTEIVEEIVAIDNDNRLGLREKWNAAADTEMRKIVITDLLLMSRLGKPEKAIELIDEVMQEIAFTNSEKLTVLQLKLNLTRRLKDSQKVDAVLDQMIGLDGVEGTTKQRLIAKKVYLMVGSGRRDQALKLLEQELTADNQASHLYLAKAQLYAAKAEHDQAMKAYQAGIETAGPNPDLVVDLVAGMADSLFATGKQADALRLLDDFAEDKTNPSDLRAETLLHSAMLMRDMERGRQARLTENRAIETAQSSKERAAIQKMVEQLRKRYQ